MSLRLNASNAASQGFTLPSLPPYRDEWLRYVETCNETREVTVDVLGGVTGVLYRSGFFDYHRLTDYLG
jgi:hypothetical protein